MTTQGFFEILGEMDDRIVSEEAGGTGRGKRNIWKAAAAIAACLALVVCAAVRLLPGRMAAGQLASDKSVSCDIASMVYVGDALYILSPLPNDWEGYPASLEGLVYLGNIQSVVASCGQPHENFQANDAILGCEVYRYGSCIAVEVDGHYLIYEPYGQSEVDRDALTPRQKAEMDPNYSGK